MIESHGLTAEKQNLFKPYFLPFIFFPLFTACSNRDYFVDTWTSAADKKTGGFPMTHRLLGLSLLWFSVRAVFGFGRFTRCSVFVTPAADVLEETEDTTVMSEVGCASEL